MHKIFLLLSAFSLFAAMDGCLQNPTAEPTGLTYDVFVVGDSWAELAQGSIALYGNDNMAATRLRALGHGVGQAHSYGFGGSSTAFWAAGDPCATPGAACNNANAYNELLSDLAAAQNPPFVYLSLGGNDLRVAGEESDFSDAATRNALFERVRDDLGSVVDALLEVREDATIVIAGYANFHFAGRSIQNIACEDFWPQFFPATSSLDEQLVNSLFAGGEHNDISVEGFTPLYEDLAAAHTQVSYTNLQLHFANDESNSWSPSRSNTMIDCLHLTPDRQRNLTVNVVNAWEASR